MTIAHVGASTSVLAGGVAGATLTAPVDGTVEDFLALIAGWAHSNAPAETDRPTGAEDEGYVHLLTQLATPGVENLGEDTGARGLSVWWRKATAVAENGVPVATQGAHASRVVYGTTSRYSKTGTSWAVVAAGGKDTVKADGWSASFTGFDVAVGDHLIVVQAVVPQAANFQQTLNWAGVTCALADRRTGATGLGGNVRVNIRSGTVTAVAAPASTFTLTSATTGGAGPAIVIRLREVSTISAALAATLPSLTAGAAGRLPATGRPIGTLPSLTAVAAARNPSTGHPGGTLPSLTGLTEADTVVRGAPALLLPSLTAQATATAPARGMFGGLLPRIGTSVTGSAVVAGTVTIGLPKISSSIAADVTGPDAVTGHPTGSLPTLAAQVQGTSVVSGSSSATMPGLTVSAAGRAPARGVVTAILPPVTTSSPDSQVRIQGSAAVELLALIAAAEAATVLRGALDGSLPAVIATGEGQIVDVPTGPMAGPWSASLPTRSWSAGLSPSTNTATLLPRRWKATSP